MSGVEIVGLAASVLQIADYGWKTSYKLYAFSKKVHDAGKTIDLISQDIGATGAVLKQLGDEVGKDEKANPGSRLCSHRLIDTASKLVKECSDLFKDIDLSIGGSDGNKVVLGFKQKLKWSYLEPRVELLRANLERLKSSLALMLNVLMYAEQVRSREERAVLVDTQTLVASFATQNANAEKRIIHWQEHVKNRLAASQDSEVATTVSSSLAVFGTLNQKTLNTQPQANLERGIPSNSVADDMPQAFQVNAVDTTAVAQGVTFRADEHGPQQENVSGCCHDDTEGIRKSSPLLLNLEHQRALIEKLLEEVNSSRYAIDHGARYRFHDGVLNLHWLEWSPMREVHGDELLRGLLSQSPILARHWHERLSVAQESASAGHHLAESDIAGVGSSKPPRAKTHAQEQPTLTPISERNYWSVRNSVVSLSIPGDIPSRPPIQLRELDSSILADGNSDPAESIRYVRDVNGSWILERNLTSHRPRVESPPPLRSKRDSGKYYMSGARMDDISDRESQEYERRRLALDPEVQRLRDDFERLKLERRGAEFAARAAEDTAERLKADLEYEKRQRSLEKRERDSAKREKVLSRQDPLGDARRPRERREVVVDEPRRPVVQARDSNRSALDRARDDSRRPYEETVEIRERIFENRENSRFHRPTNPTSLLVRRRLSQDQENLEEVDLVKTQLNPAFAVDSNAGIRGNSVHDFSAPRFHRGYLSSDNPDQETSQATPISETIEPLDDPVAFIQGLDTSVPAAAAIANSLLTQWTTVSPPLTA